MGAKKNGTNPVKQGCRRIEFDADAKLAKKIRNECARLGLDPNVFFERVLRCYLSIGQRTRIDIVTAPTDKSRRRGSRQERSARGKKDRGCTR